MCRARFGAPARTADGSGSARSAWSTPPCILSARTVHTRTTASGLKPDCRHLMSRNFSAPRSAPKPASVTTTSDSCRAARVAITELQPWAMLANGPPWMNTGFALQGLHQVRIDGIGQERGHRAVDTQVAGGHRGAVGIARDDDVAEAPLQVRAVAGET